MSGSPESELQPSNRPLTSQERRVIRAKIRSLTINASRASRLAILLAVAICCALWLWTLAASEVSGVIVTLFWLVVGGAITLWVRRDTRKHGGHSEEMARRLESALRRNAADVFEVQASSFAEFQEIEDEGACYAFQLDRDRLMFIAGQEFYPAAKFPSLDFSLVYVLDEGNQTVDMFIDKRAAKSRPARIVPAEVKATLEIPEHLQVRIGRLDALEALLKRAL